MGSWPITSDIENVTKLDVALSALKQYYKAGESDEITMVVGPTAPPAETEAAEESGAAENAEKYAQEVADSITIPASQMRLLNSMILDNTEGAYFVNDLFTGDRQEKLAQFESGIGGLRGGNSLASDIEAMDVIQIVYEKDLCSASGLKFCDTVNSVSSFINQVGVETSGDAASAGASDNDFIVNSSVSDRINSPGLVAFVLPSHKLSIATRNTDAVAIFMNYIPTLEMSKCTPFIDIKLVTETSPSLELERKEMSLARFLEWNDEDSDGIGIGHVGTVFEEYADEVISAGGVQTDEGIVGAESFVSISAAGMELFTAPQTMTNVDNGAFDKMAPFMTLDQLKLDTVGLGQALLANRVGELTFTLHDRSRLAQIAPLVAPERFGSTYLAIEYGWSHPQGDDPDKNPYGFLINAMRSRGIFTVQSTDFTIGDDGQVKLRMKLANRANSDVKIFPVICGRFMPIAPIMSLVESLVSKQNAVVSAKEAAGAKGEELVAIRNEQTLLTDDPISNGSIIPRGIFKDVVNAKRAAATMTADDFRAAIAGLNAETIMKAKDPSLVTEVDAKFIRLTKLDEDSNPVDPFFPQALNAAAVESFIFKYKASAPVVAEESGGFAMANTGIHVSLGKILMEFVGSPLAACGRYDEVQMFFYRFNVKAGAARFYDSIASFIIPITQFNLRVIEKIRNGNLSLSISQFVDLVNSEFLGRLDDPNYGVSSLRGAAEAAAETTAEDIKVINAQTMEAMAKIYNEGGGEPDFVPPRIAIYLENLPRIVPSELATDDDDNPSGQYVNYSQNILRVHVYDMKASPYDDEAFILRSASANDLAVRVAGEQPISRPFRPFGVNHSLAAAIKAQQVVEAGSGTTTTSDGSDFELKSYTSGVSSIMIKELVKQTVPSITLGLAFSAIKSFNMASNTSGPVNDALMLNAIDNDHIIGNTSGRTPTQSMDPITVIPASVSITTLGCPLVEYGSHFFLDPGTGTTADNMYIINKISHTLAAGQFDTSLGLAFADSGTVKNIRAKLAAIETPSG